MENWIPKHGVLDCLKDNPDYSEIVLINVSDVVQGFREKQNEKGGLRFRVKVWGRKGKMVQASCMRRRPLRTHVPAAAPVTGVPCSIYIGGTVVPVK